MAARRTTTVHQHVRAPRAAVYRLLLDPAAIPQWKVPEGMTAEVHLFEPRVGGRVLVSLRYEGMTLDGKTEVGVDTYSGRFVELVQDERVVEVDSFETGDPTMQGEMTSTITLVDAADGGTDVTGTHDGVPEGVSLADNETGWRMSLARLAALAEQPVAHRWYTRPVFIVADVNRAARFYVEMLGFTKGWHEADGAGSVCQVNHGECEIILTEDRARSDRGRLFIELTAEGVADLRRELEARGAPMRAGWWGYPTIEVTDPDGNELLFPIPE